jgi:hypothetical protein
MSSTEPLKFMGFFLQFHGIFAPISWMTVVRLPVTRLLAASYQKLKLLDRLREFAGLPGAGGLNRGAGSRERAAGS